jgi:small conductance mechanosensitive channel
MAEETDQNAVVEYLQTNSGEIADHIGEYSHLVGDAMFFIILGILSVLAVQKLVARLIYPYLENRRLLNVMFATLYLLVLVLTGLMVLRKVGFDVSNGGPIAILAVLFLGVILYFIIPFLPRLPFMPGHMVVAQGEMGTVEGVSSFHTTLRKFDGTMVFMPNALVLASKILNYSYDPNRRIEMKLIVSPDSDLKTVKERLLGIAANEHRVLGDPAPAVFAFSADASGVELMFYCWVENGDFLGTRSDLWEEVLRLVKEDPAVSLSAPLRDINLVDARSSGD